MKVTRSITIQDTDFAPLYSELSAMSDHAFDGVDASTHEGHAFSTKFPMVAKLLNILQVEAVKEQSTFNYERIK